MLRPPLPARPLRPLRPLLAVLLLLLLLLGGERAARALDRFEIQVYDGTANAPREAALETHVNGVVDGVKTAPPPELPTHHMVHMTLEPSFGVTRFWELGAYLQTALRPGGDFDFAGVKLRSKLVTPPGWRPHLRLGCNVEVSYLPAAYDPGHWGGEIRPIVAWENDRWLLAANPIVDLSLTEGEADFEPAAMALLRLSGAVAIGLEYYASLGPLLSPSALADQGHVLFEAITLTLPRGLDLNLAVGEGLTSASNGLTIKAIIGWAPGASAAGGRTGW